MSEPRVMDAVIRVSRVNGRSGESFMSPDEQEETIDRWAAATGTVIARRHLELDASGRTTDRAGLQDAVDRALAGDTDGIVVAKVDRFARNLVAGLTAVGELRKAGRSFVAVKDGVDGEQASTSTGRMLLGILFLFAQWQLESLTEQWADVRTRSVAAGVAAHDAYGYRKGPDKRLVPDEAERPWVVRMFSERAAGLSWTAIADLVNDAGATDPAARPRRAERFTHARIKSIVENRTYLGEVRSGKLVNAQAHEPLVTPALWDAANGLRQTATRRDHGTFLLAGIIRCPSCGVRMAGTSDARKLADGSTVVYRSYRCRRTHSFGRCPAPTRVRADHIDPIAEARFRELYLTERSPVWTPSDDDGVAEATDGLETARAELRAYLRAASALDAEDFEVGLNVRQAAVDGAKKRLQDARAAETGVSLPHDLADDWDSLSVAERRLFLSRGLAAVAVAPGAGDIAERAAVWAWGDPSLPPGLPGYGSDVTAITPLDVAAATGVSAGA